MPSLQQPKLRPVEVFPIEQDGERLLVVNDPSNLSVGNIVISGPALFVFTLLDGQHDLEQIQEKFEKQFSQSLPLDELNDMLAQLDAAHYLESEGFTTYFKDLVDGYRAAPARISASNAGTGLNGEDCTTTIQRMLGHCEVSLTGTGNRRLAGLIAPHLDYPRGTPCYADAYGVLATMPPPKRVVILGTNHFGRSSSSVATRKDFQTPLGTTRTDREFIAALEQSCGSDLCEHEFDHLREHSIELQVLVLQHLFGAENFEIVPVLCSDPCGPTGTAPHNGRGVDLRVFAEALGALVRKDDTPTIIIAGADLSHVGRRFGDTSDLDKNFLTNIERYDRRALVAVSKNDHEKFLNILTETQNQTRVCSVGCIYALMTALPDASAELLRYHQAADIKSETCVTCAAVAFWE